MNTSVDITVSCDNQSPEVEKILHSFEERDEISYEWNEDNCCYDVYVLSPRPWNLGSEDSGCRPPHQVNQLKLKVEQDRPNYVKSILKRLREKGLDADRY